MTFYGCTEKTAGQLNTTQLPLKKCKYEMKSAILLLILKYKMAGILNH